jgi:hypothetical protein
MFVSTMQYQTTSIDIVIARFNENVSWIIDVVNALKLDNIKIRVFIYNKGSPLNTNLFNSLQHELQIKDLPNVGHEGHSYLTYMVDEYESYSKDPFRAVLFTQGNTDEHIKTWCRGFKDPADLFNAMISDTINHGASVTWANKHEYVGNCAAFYDFKIAQHNGKDLFPRSEYTFGEWFNKYIRSDLMTQNTMLDWWIGGLFAVHATCLAKQKKEFFEKLLDQLSKDLDPEVGHFFERAWLYITGADEFLINYHKALFDKTGLVHSKTNKML